MTCLAYPTYELSRYEAFCAHVATVIQHTIACYSLENPVAQIKHSPDGPVLEVADVKLSPWEVIQVAALEENNPQWCLTAWVQTVALIQALQLRDLLPGLVVCPMTLEVTWPLDP